MQRAVKYVTVLNLLGSSTPLANAFTITDNYRTEVAGIKGTYHSVRKMHEMGACASLRVFSQPSWNNLVRKKRVRCTENRLRLTHFAVSEIRQSRDACTIYTSHVRIRHDASKEKLLVRDQHPNYIRYYHNAEFHDFRVVTPLLHFNFKHKDIHCQVDGV
jgi:hypothetical protein